MALFRKNDYWAEKDPGKLAKILSKVQKEQDPDTLARIALEAPASGVAGAAVGKIHSYDRLMSVYRRRPGLISEIAAALADDPSRIRFLAEAPFEDSLSAKEVVRSIRDRNTLYGAVCSGTCPGNENAARAVIELAESRDMLEKISAGGKGILQDMARKRLEDILGLEAVAMDDSESIERRFEAAKKLEEQYGDSNPKRELQKLGTPGPMFHILYRTVFREWEQVGYICLRCGRTGGRTDDDESTRHYGCDFSKEVCTGR